MGFTPRHVPMFRVWEPGHYTEAEANDRNWHYQANDAPNAARQHAMRLTGSRRGSEWPLALRVRRVEHRLPANRPDYYEGVGPVFEVRCSLTWLADIKVIETKEVPDGE